MAFQISPGVNVSEVDQTTVVPAVITTAGAFAGNFSWGPADQLTLVDSELTLINQFGKPNDASATSFFTAANFLAYANALKLVRVVGTGAKNAVASGTAVLIKNEIDWEANYAAGQGSVGSFAAKYPGTLGNSIKVSMCDSATYEKSLTGTMTATLTAVLGVGTAFTTEAHVGGLLYTTSGALVGTVLSITDDTHLTLTANAAATNSGAT